MAPFVKERRWHPSQRVVSKGDGTIIMSLEVAVTPELVQWVLGFGAEAEVIEPRGLQEELMSAADAVGRMYRARAA